MIRAGNALPARGACFGFEIRSELEFRLLHEGTGRPLTVVEKAIPFDRKRGRLLQSWGGEEPTARLLRTSEGFGVELGGGQRFRVDEDGGRIDVPPASNALRRETRLWTTPAAVAMVLGGRLALHGGAVAIGDRAVLLTGPSGSGKTTTAAALFEAGHRLLSDDLSCCATDPDPVLWPGPALLRLRPDAADRLSLEEAGTPHDYPGRRHLIVAPRLRGDGEAVPLAGIICLVGEGAEPRFRRMEPSEVVRSLWAMSFYLPDDQRRASCFRMLVELADRVPGWSLRWRPRWKVLPTVIAGIESRLGG